MCFIISPYLRDTKRWCLESPRFSGNIVLPLKQCRASASLQKCYHFRVKGRSGRKSGIVLFFVCVGPCLVFYCAALGVRSCCVFAFSFYVSSLPFPSVIA